MLLKGLNLLLKDAVLLSVLVQLKALIRESQVFLGQCFSSR